MNGRIILIALLLSFAACKPVELQQMDLKRQHITVHEPGRTIRTSVNPDKPERVNRAYTYFWFEGGRINQSQGAYSGKLLDGLFTVKEPETKHLLEQGNFKHGLKSGQWLSWNEDGTLKETKRYRNGIVKIRKSPDTTGLYSRVKKYVGKKLQLKKKKK